MKRGSYKFHTPSSFIREITGILVSLKIKEAQRASLIVRPDTILVVSAGQGRPLG